MVGADSAVMLPRRWRTGGFPGERLGCAMNIFRRSDIQPGQTVAIIGIGFLGAMLPCMATEARGLAVTRRPWAGDASPVGAGTSGEVRRRRVHSLNYHS